MYKGLLLFSIMIPLYCFSTEYSCTIFREQYINGHYRPPQQSTAILKEDENGIKYFIPDNKETYSSGEMKQSPSENPFQKEVLTDNNSICSGMSTTKTIFTNGETIYRFKNLQTQNKITFFNCKPIVQPINSCPFPEDKKPESKTDKPDKPKPRSKKPKPSPNHPTNPTQQCKIS